MKLKKIKLNSFDASNLDDQEMNLIKGGNSCQEHDHPASCIACGECTTPTPTPTPLCNGGGL